ncbi:MAG: hypothetical protein ACQETE_15435 [Bacteroidota bacterium]
MRRSVFLSIVSVAALFMAFYQAFWVAPAITTADPHSDALIYLEMSQHLDFFGSTHITFRWILPLLAYLLHFVFIGVSTHQSLVLAYALLNVGFFVLGLWAFWKLVNPRPETHYLPAISPLFLLLGVPFFWRTAFLPLVDTAAFAMIALILLAFRDRNLLLLLLASLLAVFIKEISLLIILALPLIDWANRRTWVIGYLIPWFAVLIYGLTTLIALESPDQFYLLQPEHWLGDWTRTIDELSWQDLRYPLSAFGLLLPAIIFVFFSDPDDRAYTAGSLLLFFFFLVFWMFTPSNSPRLMFMMLPLTYLFFRNE